jgi:hypothetical protein
MLITRAGWMLVGTSVTGIPPAHSAAAMISES